MAGAAAGLQAVVFRQLAAAGRADRVALALSVGAAIAAGIAVYLAAARLLRSPELAELAAAFRRRAAPRAGAGPGIS